MTDRDDIERYITQAAMGNQSAFSNLYDACASKLFGICLKVLGNREHAEDALQDAFIKIWHSADKYQANGLSPMTWLITIARNTAIDRLRANRTQYDSSVEPDDLEDSNDGPEAQSLATSQQMEISRCLEQLESNKAEAVRFAYLQGLSYADLAERYEVPINTMRTWLRRSLLKLKGCLAND